MSDFSVKIVRIKDIEPIDGADAIEQAVIGDYRSVVKKGQFRRGQLAAYIPEASVLPLSVSKALGLEGRLAGSAKNRVKAIRLRGCLSQGILYPVDNAQEGPFINVPTEDGIGTLHSVEEGDDVAEVLGITKYEPPIPVHMAGEVSNAGFQRTLKYDIENFKAYPDVFVEGENVYFTEKVHGTFCCIGVVPKAMASDELYRGQVVIFSKGLGAKGLSFKPTENNDNNLYVRTMNRYKLIGQLMYHFENTASPFFFLGEIIGTGVQDLSYGCNDPEFRVFDVAMGFRDSLMFFNRTGVERYSEILGLKTVPVLYKGPFSKQKMIEYTTGKETISGNQVHIREGIVIKPQIERKHFYLGRVVLKSVSEDYLLRKGDTTEYQ